MTRGARRVDRRAGAPCRSRRSSYPSPCKRRSTLRTGTMCGKSTYNNTRDTYTRAHIMRVVSDCRYTFEGTPMTTNHHGAGFDPFHTSSVSSFPCVARCSRGSALAVVAVLAASLAAPVALQPALAYDAQAAESAAAQQTGARPDDLMAALAPYDEQIRQAGSAKDLAAAAADGTLPAATELLVLQRELVARAGGTKLWEYAATSRSHNEFVMAAQRPCLPCATTSRAAPYGPTPRRVYGRRLSKIP